ncbi:MAG: hypothetical protein IJT34_04175 [Butyrivibrio sp.]|nr:hypothetical protein [Butyrivibrio sp.]
MKKKILSVLLSAAMVTGLLAGCGSSAESPSTATGSGTASSSASSSDSKVKLKALFIAHPLTDDINNMKFIQEFADNAGVEIEWEEIWSDWDQTKPTRFASGDIPDLLFNATTDADYITYNGLFEDLTPYISADKTPNIQAMFDEEPDTLVLAKTLEGKLFGLPKFQGKWPGTNGVMFINQTWLDKLGLSKPTTFSEFEQVLLAFKNEDPNGNGQADEVPLDFNGWFGSAYSLSNMIGSLGIQLTNWGTDAYFAEDGQIKNYAVDERYKKLMKYLAKLYSEGLINENAITNDYSMFQSLSRGNEAGEALVGVVYGWEETDKFGNNLASQYVALEPLAYDLDGESYDPRWTYDYSGLNMSTNRVCMSAKCSNKEAAMKFLDQFYGQAASVQVLFGGITDGNVSEVGENSYKVNDPQDPAVDPGTWKWTHALADNGPMYIRRATQIQMTPDMDNALREREAYNTTLAKVGDSDYYPQMFMKYTEAEQNEMAVAQANVNNVTDNQWGLWLVGDADVDATWDEYVAAVNAAGLPRLLEIRQKAFDSYRNQ